MQIENKPKSEASLKTQQRQPDLELGLRKEGFEFELITLLRSEGRHGEAIHEIKRLNKMPANIGYQSLLLDIYFENSHTELALLKIDEILMVGGLSSHFYYLLLLLKIECLLKLSRVNEAFLSLAQAEKIDVDDELLAWKGILLMKKNQVDKAKFCFDQSILLNPNNEKAWMGIAGIHCLKGDYELGLACYKKIIDESANNSCVRAIIEKFESLGVKL